jgi:predicted Zn-dependent protease
MMRLLLIGLIVAATSARAADLRYWIEPCTNAETACQKGDVQLAEWALQDWQKASGGKLKFEKAAQMSLANIRIHWAAAEEGQYGETVGFVEGNLRGANVYVRPNLSALGPDIAEAASKDSLLRETIVYLTCLHESGHALGLSHTDQFADIMYFFGNGGNIPEYFGRYRRKLRVRADIANNSGISANDRMRLLQVLK